MWKIQKKPSPHKWLDFDPVEVLDEYDSPTIFTLRDAQDLKYLAYFCGRDKDRIRFLVVSFNDTLESQLIAGEIDLREALNQPGRWVFDLNKEWEPVSCWRVTYEDMPRNLLPKPGVMLRAGMRSVAKRLLVQSVGDGSVTTVRFNRMPHFAEV
jgi:hypothetical protein